MFGKKKDAPEMDAVIRNRIRELEGLGFKAGLSKEPPAGFPGADTVVTVNLRDRKERSIGGSAGYQLEKIREVLESDVIKSDMMPGKGKVYNYDIEALMELMAFVMGFRKQYGSMTVFCNEKGIEITCSASDDRDGSLSGYFMRGTLESNIQKLIENGNEVIPGYNHFENELFIKISLPKFFVRAEMLLDGAKISGMRFGAVVTGEEINEMARKSPRGKIWEP